MYRFLLQPKWIGFHLLVIAAIVTMVNLGMWQLRRLDERQAFNATVEARYDEPPVPLDDLLTDDTDPDGDGASVYLTKQGPSFFWGQSFGIVNTVKVAGSWQNNSRRYNRAGQGTPASLVDSGYEMETFLPCGVFKRPLIGHHLIYASVIRTLQNLTTWILHGSEASIGKALEGEVVVWFTPNPQ